MAENNSDLHTEIVETCIFCLIANDQDEDTEVIKKNKELVCFRDIVPAAPHHYLVVPIQHIDSCLSLHGGDVGLVERMAEMGKSVLRDQGITDMNDIRLGFHRPPFTSIDHLHLHVLAPTSQIYSYVQYKFIPESYRFVTEESFRKSLKNKASPVKKTRLAANQNCPCGCDAFCPTCLDVSAVDRLDDLCERLLVLTPDSRHAQTLPDDELLCFRDVKPGATHHYLVIPRTHIENCKSLQLDDVPLVERMQEMGRSILEKNRVSNLDDVRMGFHIPPFSSVPHLHLHALAPASTMAIKSQLRYGPQSHWFITVDKVLSQLKIRGKVK